MGPQFDYCLRATNNPSYFALPDKDGERSASPGVSEANEPGAAACSRSGLGRWAAPQSPLRREPPSPRRREFRALLRSLSAREPEAGEAFLRGQPRAGDCAPADMRHSATAPRIRKGKISSSVMTAGGVQEREEVFYTLPLLSRRRHSVGGYLAAGAGVETGDAVLTIGEVTAVPSELPKMPPPRIPHRPDEDNRRRRPKNFNLKGMEDIAILWSAGSPESELWSDYLVTCFDKIMSQRARHHYRVTPMTVEELINSESPEKLEKLIKAQLQIVILCPKLATKMCDLKRVTNLEQFFKVDKVLVMLLGTEKDDVVAKNIIDYPEMEQWQMMYVREKDTSFVDTFLTSAVGVLRTKDCKDTATDRTTFSIVPKKVKIGQSRVIALLNDPIKEEDSIKIMVDKKGEVTQISSFKKRNPYTLQFDIPESCLDVSMLVWVRVTKNGQPLGRRQIKCESRLRELDQLLRASDHPLEFMCQTLGFKSTKKEQLDSWMLAAFQKNIPPHFNLLSSQEQFNPKLETTSGDEYPTLLHWAARFGLERLCWQLLECPGGGAACSLRNVRHLTPPELARESKHHRLAEVLSSHLQMNEFSNMYYYLKNMTENSTNGQSENKINDELKIVETCDTVDGGEINKNDEEPTADPFSEECSKNLEDTEVDKNTDIDKPIINRPNLDLIITHKEQLLDKNTDIDNNVKNRPNLDLIIPPKEQLYQNDLMFPHDDDTNRLQQAIEHDYLVQPSNIKVENPKFRPNNLYVNSSRLIRQQSDIFIYSPTEETKLFCIDTPTSDISQINLNFRDTKGNGNGSVKSGRETGYPLSGQEELAEIINDFKNNVFTISEVEKLVMEWRNRNETQQSLKEKQEQLNKMREEYDKIQQRIKENLKRPTPFERVKKMFSKGKNKHGDTNNGSIEKRNGNTRPNSSLSESSSSSGRLSTVSGASLGDNSTQYDNDDKPRSFMSSSTLTMQSSSSDVEVKLDDYLIPPPPRPLNGTQAPLITFGHPRNDRVRVPPDSHSRGQHMATIVERETSSCEQLEREPDATHVRLSFERDHDRPNHMYMNLTTTH